MISFWYLLQSRLTSPDRFLESRVHETLSVLDELDPAIRQFRVTALARIQMMEKGETEALAVSLLFLDRLPKVLLDDSPDRVRCVYRKFLNEELLPRHDDLYGAFCAACQDLGVPPERTDLLKEKFFSL